jgi:hypothetical protein
LKEAQLLAELPGAMPLALQRHGENFNLNGLSKWGQRFAIESQGSKPLALVIRGTGPRPLLCSATKPAANGIGVHVVDLLIHCRRLDNIAVIASAALPESIMNQRRDRSLLKNGWRRKHEKVRAWAWPTILYHLQDLRCPGANGPLAARCTMKPMIRHNK